MAEALKCDRCGKFYIYAEEFSSKNEKVIQNEVNKYKVRHIKYASVDDSGSYHYLDLCIDCVHEFCNWFNRTSEFNPKFPIER